MHFSFCFARSIKIPRGLRLLNIQWNLSQYNIHLGTEGCSVTVKGSVIYLWAMEFHGSVIISHSQVFDVSV